MSHKTPKKMIFMALGSLFITLGAVISGNAGINLALSPVSVITSFVMAFIMFFIGGFFWTIVAASIGKNEKTHHHLTSL